MKTIVHIIISGNWAGSEAAAFALANTQSLKHQVFMVVKEGNQFKQQSYQSHLYSNIQLICFKEHQTAQDIIQQLSTILPDQKLIIHTHLGTATYIGMQIKNIRPKIKVIAHMHIRYYQEQFGQTDAVIAVSPWQLYDIPESYEGKSCVIRNFVSPKCDRMPDHELESQKRRFFISPEDHVFGIISRLHIEKGIDTAIRAMQLVKNEKFKLIIFGHGEELNHLKELAAHDPRIHFAGFVNGGYAYMKLFNSYISPSRCESFGISQIEAYFSGINILASKTYGSRDIFADDPSNNNLFEIDNEFELAELMLKAKDGQIQSNVNSSLYSMEYNTEQLDQFYDEILASSKHSSLMPY